MNFKNYFKQYIIKKNNNDISIITDFLGLLIQYPKILIFSLPTLIKDSSILILVIFFLISPLRVVLNNNINDAISIFFILKVFIFFFGVILIVLLERQFSKKLQNYLNFLKSADFKFKFFNIKMITLYFLSIVLFPLFFIYFISLEVAMIVFFYEIISIILLIKLFKIKKLKKYFKTKSSKYLLSHLNFTVQIMIFFSYIYFGFFNEVDILYIFFLIFPLRQISKYKSSFAFDTVFNTFYNKK
jgi:hypothetical protein